MSISQNWAVEMSVDIHTFGCRLNAYESEAIRLRTREAELDNAVIVNTCAVTAEAVRQSRQAIRKLRRENPEAKLIVTGCAAQIEPERFAAMGDVDLVLGNAEKLEAKSYTADFPVQGSVPDWAATQRSRPTKTRTGSTRPNGGTD